MILNPTRPSRRAREPAAKRTAPNEAPIELRPVDVCVVHRGIGRVRGRRQRLGRAGERCRKRAAADLPGRVVGPIDVARLSATPAGWTSRRLRPPHRCTAMAHRWRIARPRRLRLWSSRRATSRGPPRTGRPAHPRPFWDYRGATPGRNARSSYRRCPAPSTALRGCGSGGRCASAKATIAMKGPSPARGNLDDRGDATRRCVRNRYEAKPSCSTSTPVIAARHTTWSRSMSRASSARSSAVPRPLPRRAPLRNV